jgi:hypothetical protein
MYITESANKSRSRLYVKDHKVKPIARLTGIKPAARRINKTPYQILRLATAGEIEVEMVDGRPKVVIASLKRFKAAAR